MTGRRGRLAAIGLAALAGLALAALALAGPAAAQDDAGDGWAGEERELSFQRDDDGFAFTSTRDTERAHDVIEGRFDLSTATYRLTLVDEPEEGAEGIVPATNETWMRLELAFVELIEYRDVAEDGGFSPTSDEIVRRVELEDYRTPILRTSTTDDGTHKATVTFPFSSGGGLELAFHVAPAAYESGDRALPPTLTAFDVRLSEYPFEAEGTNVALHTRLSSTPATEPGDGEPVLTVPPATEQPFEGRYAWGTSLDGANTTNATVVEWPSGGQAGAAATTNVLFAYPRSDEIRHAGTVGFDEPAPDDVLGLIGDWTVFGLALAGTAALVAASMYLQLKDERSWPPGARTDASAREDTSR